MSAIPFDEFKVRELPRDVKHWRNAFDSRYLRYFWLNGQPRIVTITKVQELTSSNKKESKKQLLITLAEAEKPWAANVTNCGIIEMLTGKENPRDWVGARIELYPSTTRYPNGQMGPCMRVREQLPAEGAKTAAPKHRQEVSAYLAQMKEATDLAALVPVGGAMAEDQSLTPQELDFLRGAMKKRAEQLDGAA
jgi:hypothetical protein